MSELEARKLRLTRKWMEIAESDCLVARSLLIQTEFNARIQIAFFSQQCAEKYLKAWLCLHDVDFPYIHDIRQLRNRCLVKKGMWAAELYLADWLTPFSTKFRYPSETEDVSPDDAKRALVLAESVRDVLRTVLKNDIAAMYVNKSEPEIAKEIAHFDLFYGE